MQKLVPVGVSARHIHLSPEHIEQLFGQGYELKSLKPLSQPGQFAAEETVAVHGPKGRFDTVRILGPARGATQLEVSRTDAFALGIRPPVRLSGHTAGTPGIRIVGPAGEVAIEEGVIIAARHVHLHTTDAERLGIADQQKLSIRVNGERGLVFHEVVARVHEQFALDFHIDTDEANAAGAQNGDMAEIIGT